jgi:hypothetical protein
MCTERQCLREGDMQRKLSWQQKKDKICFLIKKISNSNGGDEEIFINDFCLEIFMNYKNDLDVPLQCFEDLEKQPMLAKVKKR